MHHACRPIQTTEWSRSIRGFQIKFNEHLLNINIINSCAWFVFDAFINKWFVCVTRRTMLRRRLKLTENKIEAWWLGIVHDNAALVIINSTIQISTNNYSKSNIRHNMLVQSKGRFCWLSMNCKTKLNAQEQR